MVEIIFETHAIRLEESVIAPFDWQPGWRYVLV